MKFIRNASWNEVFEIWRQNEATNPGWIECATKIKGWSDWESWRLFSAKQFGAENLSWSIFQFEDPVKEVPEMLVGPFSSWQSEVVDKNRTSFKEIIDNPVQYKKWVEHSRVSTMINDLPFATGLIGIFRKDIGKIVCIEGHHRAVSFSLVQKQGRMIDFSRTPIIIALAELPVNDCHLLDEMLERGTSKEV